MRFTRALGTTTIAAGIGLAAAFGMGTASADPGGPCTPPACQDQHRNDRNDRNQAPVDWHGRGVDQGRQDHQPFNWNGQQVTPMPAGNGAGWGFWFLGQWIPL